MVLRDHAITASAFSPAKKTEPIDRGPAGDVLSPFGPDAILESVERASRLAPRLRAGSAAVNTLGRNPETPFGSFKQSGVGRDGGSYGLAASSELQSVIWPS